MKNTRYTPQDLQRAIVKSNRPKGYTRSDATQAYEAEIIISVTTPYSFTLRKTTDPNESSMDDYKTKLAKFSNMGISITDHVYENNIVNNGIHCHGVMQIPKKFNMNRFRTRGWHIKLDEIYDRPGWDAYMAKQQILEQNETDTPTDDFKMPTKSLFTK